MDIKSQRYVHHNKHVENWSVEEVGQWLESNGFGAYRTLFCDTHRIDGQVLITLTFDDLRNQLSVCVFGDARRLCNALDALKQFYLPVPPRIRKRLIVHRKQDTPVSKDSSETIESSSSNVHSSIDSLDDEIQKAVPEAVEKLKFRIRKSLRARSEEFRPDMLKALLSLLYAFITTWVTAFVMVIVHDRVPDMETYPPLPDIMLDNLPLIPWAFGICELCGLILLFAWVFILAIHKHRFILIRRMFSLFGSVFLLRCVTMLLTSLSVPGRHLNCKARKVRSWKERFHQAYLIWSGAGMSIKGVRTCGDYMYSGHTVVLTMLNFFITEYTPNKFYIIHTSSWILNCFGLFFILAAHEHYSIDVFVGFYISTRIFLYYHTLANNRALYQSDSHRTRIWFPLFSFFEANVPGIVPNEFENPYKVLKHHICNLLGRFPMTSKYFNPPDQAKNRSCESGHESAHENGNNT